MREVRAPESALPFLPSSFEMTKRRLAVPCATAMPGSFCLGRAGAVRDGNRDAEMRAAAN